MNSRLKGDQGKGFLARLLKPETTLIIPVNPPLPDCTSAMGLWRCRLKRIGVQRSNLALSPLRVMPRRVPEGNNS